MLVRPGAQEPKDILPSPVTELAPAKINLALHVTGQRADGYHLLDSIVTFADIGDRLHFSASGEDVFSLSGRFSETLATEAGSNLVIRARDGLRSLLAAAGFETPPVAIHLEKNLPVASGIGGGSADAAAALRGLLRFWQAELPPADLARLALSLGADVPMCLQGTPLIARGIGEDLTPLPDLPRLALALGNPLCSVSTPQVFARLASKQNMPLPPLENGDWIRILPTLRNDLEAPARELAPQIGELSVLLDGEGSLLTRMSGSGATCFGVFASRAEADRAAARLQALKPAWYFQATTTVSGA
ncbi:4-(cytidine 5'-diphospho)-2-C-methyl-D-erythritol kinase [Pseudorhizobium pelagicum]|uniref:4-(cytidine 5'-diphospho)-2-C-methyl-D-erythritol kinase n=1 Tax=Pseudorhizobium pelagicum TaxID=1509405 RepID=UPI000690C8F9|nr:4-(cytidine 5'-diphospho)-2-C-methyl-D-erythritol kinase [Pseudorhizobium pelagicum]